MTELIESKTPDELYEFLLDDIHENNIMDFEESSIKIFAPEIYFDITRKTVWKNFVNYPDYLNRDESHMIAFVNKELKTTTSKNKDNNLLINGRKNMNQIKTILSNYININVKCAACKSINTNIFRNQSLRLDFIKCNVCNVESVIKK